MTLIRHREMPGFSNGTCADTAIFSDAFMVVIADSTPIAIIPVALDMYDMGTGVVVRICVFPSPNYKSGRGSNERRGEQYG